MRVFCITVGKVYFGKAAYDTSYSFKILRTEPETLVQQSEKRQHGINGTKPVTDENIHKN